jgi:peptidoglycan/xylan/chitin deacetylase (PgdA/CDA1 family)
MGRLNFLTWAQLREMQDSGVFDIESHTDDLHYKVDDRPVFLAASEQGYSFEGQGRWRDVVRSDLQRSRAAIARNVGHGSRYLAWPYGLGDEPVDSLAVEAGFERIVLLHDGLNPSFVPQHGDTLPAARRLGITRYAVSARTSMRAFKRMLSGEYMTVHGY